MTNFWYIRRTIELSFIEKTFKHLHVTKKNKKELFMILIVSKPFPPLPFFLCQKA